VLMLGRAARVAWLREQQEAGRMPAINLYWCPPCALWTITVAGTKAVHCTCGTAPVFLETVTAPGPEERERDGERVT